MVGGAALLVGNEVDLRVTSKVEIPVGRMLFASMASGDWPLPPARRRSGPEASMGG